MKDNNDKPSSSPESKSCAVRAAQNAQELFGREFVLQMASSFVGIGATTIASLPLTSPALNVLNRRYHLQAQDPRATYRNILRDIFYKEGVGGFYEQSGRNASRRIGGLGFGFAVAESFGQHYQLDNLTKSSIAAISEVAISFGLGEISERRKTARANDIPPHRMGAFCSVLARNMMFTTSVYSKKITENFMEKVGNDMAEQLDLKPETIETLADFAVKCTFLSLTTPLDKAATKFAIGHNPIAEYLANPRALFNGGVVRVTYGLLVSASVKYGLEAGKFIYEKLDNGRSESPKI